MPRKIAMDKARVVEKRKQIEGKIEGIRRDLNLIETGRERLGQEHESLSVGVPELTISAFNGGGEQARTQLKETNRRLREIEAEIANIASAKRELEGQLQDAEAEIEGIRLALLQAEDESLAASEKELIGAFHKAADELGAALKKIGGVEEKRANIAKDMGADSPRWASVSRELSNYLLWRVGRKAGTRRYLDLADASDPTGTWIAQRTAQKQQERA